MSAISVKVRHRISCNMEPPLSFRSEKCIFYIQKYMLYFYLFETNFNDLFRFTKHVAAHFYETHFSKIRKYYWV